MKDAEDEAFDELARKQGAWGGGFTAKRKMAADKLWDKPSVAFDEWWNGDNDESTNPFRLESGAYWAWAGWKAALAQPAQEPPSEWAGIKAILDEYGLQAIDFVADFKAFLEQPAQEPVTWAGVDFDINTAPPQRTWVGLTDEEIYKTYWRREPFRRPTQFEFARDIEQLLKEKNNGL